MSVRDDYGFLTTYMEYGEEDEEGCGLLEYAESQMYIEPSYKPVYHIATKC